MNSNFTVVYDACVLFPAPLRDLLMRLAMTDVFRARWTDRIHEEWMRAVLGIRPDLKRADLERTRTLMNDHVRDCLVTGYEHLIDSIELPDPDAVRALGREEDAADRHGGLDAALRAVRLR